MDIGSKEFKEYADKANIPNCYRIWANCLWMEAQRQATESLKCCGNCKGHPSNGGICGSHFLEPCSNWQPIN